MHISELPVVKRKSHFSHRFCQESIIYRFIGRRPLFRRLHLDDHVKALRSRPLGMFFYNLRAIFLVCGAVFLAALWLVLLAFPYTPKMLQSVQVLVVFWALDMALTLVLHRGFIRKLNVWVSSPVTQSHPHLFGRYFLLDSFIVFFLLGVGKLLSLPLDGFASLIFANSVVYSSAYMQGRKSKKQITLILFLQIAVIGILLLDVRGALPEFDAEPVPEWFNLLLNIVPLVGMALMTVLSLSFISELRSGEYEVAQHRLNSLMRYEHMLSKSSADGSDAEQADHSERQFRRQVTQVLESLCKPESPFWYRSACLWFVETHEDRGDVLLPGPCVNFVEAANFKNGLDDVDKVSHRESPVLLRSLKRHIHAADSSEPVLKFRQDLDAPAAFIPLRRDNRRIGVLALYGEEEEGPPLLDEDERFLWFVGSIIINTMEQWEGRYRAVALKEMDDLYSCNTLEEVFPEAVKILKKYLEAAGCMVIFRPERHKAEMAAKAEDGFVHSIIRKADYRVGVGQTGACAAEGRSIRWDDVQGHLEEFDAERMKILEKAHHGKKIVSWMAIPIGQPEENYGVVKVVNSIFRCSWFTEQDQRLGEDLARRLHIMIEKFLQIKRIEEHARRTEEATKRAEEKASEALAAQNRAEHAARQRQDDLTIITHQLQGPLSSVIGSITNIQRKLINQEVQDIRLKYVHALVEDALALCFGTFSTFGREAGRETYFGASNIDAPKALKNLCERIQKTNGGKKSLTFKYKFQEGFPTLHMDGRVFTSVFYSLVHNAMKYAAPHTYVTMECSFERATGKAALKVKSLGEPIMPNETEEIFKKYRRGSVMATTGRHHSGIGLGLWVARELMQAVGGDVTVELSPNDPKLSVFIVHVPVAGKP